MLWMERHFPLAKIKTTAGSLVGPDEQSFPLMPLQNADRVSVNLLTHRAVVSRVIMRYRLRLTQFNERAWKRGFNEFTNQRRAGVHV
jgi:hypothetical protein